MEIKAELKYPYSEIDRISFIVENNHKKGYEIRYAENSYTAGHEDLQAYGYTEEEIAEQEKAKAKQEIIAKLEALDLKSIRAIRANDTEYIAKYEAEAEELRKQL